MRPRPPYIPLAIPKDLSERIIRLHGNPIVWWLSQFIKYLLRPQDSIQQLLNNIEAKLDFKHPVVGYVYSNKHFISFLRAFSHVSFIIINIISCSFNIVKIL